MSLTNVDLPDPETPVTAVSTAQRETHVDAAQVVLAGSDDREPGVRSTDRRMAGTSMTFRPDR
jgi:hypothetical protein